MAVAKQHLSNKSTPGKHARALVTTGVTNGVTTGLSINKPVRKYKVKRGNSAMFKKIVTAAPLTGLAAIKAIRDGYLVSILKSASSFFDVSDARIQSIVHVPATTASRLEQKKAKIDAAATERVYRMSVVARMAIDVFGDQDAAIAWMRQPNRVFGNVAPLDLMDTEPGAVAVKQVLNAIATGGVA